MMTKRLSAGLASLLAVAASGAYAGEPAARPASGAPAPEIEEIVVYGERPMPIAADTWIKARLPEQLRILTEQLGAELEIERKSLLAPKIRVAITESPLVVELPQA